MPLKRLSYRIQVILRIILILSLGFAGVILITETAYWMVAMWLGLLLILLIVELIRFHERSRNALRDFLVSIKQEDFSTLSTLNEKDGELQEAYQMILDKFKDLRIEKETHYHYLQRVIEHVDAALICIDHNMDIQLINKTAKDLLQVPDIKDLRSLEKIDTDLVTLIRDMDSGHKEIIRLVRHGKILNLSVRATTFSLEKDKYKIVSLHDIKTELEEQEVESWQKLVRILTHEIMNSTIPITNMVGLARDFLVDDEGNPKEIPGLEKEEIDDLVESLATAEKRSKGLVKFVQTTKDLARIPEPSISEIRAEDLFNRLKGFFKNDLKQLKIDFKLILCKPDLVINADLEMIEQVLINLLKNSMEAVKDAAQPKIKLTADQLENRAVTISVCDNGPGIPEENLENIFIPFFSTKKEGSGIGLSLSRQIMKLHRGRIDVETEQGAGTTFTLEF
jgi:nitrogen fixation/metabolism regulation signal transduction histidine kinase